MVRSSDGPDGRCFLAAWVVSMSFRNVGQKLNLPTWKGNSSPRCSARAYYRETPFSERGNVPLSGHTVNKLRRPAVLQLNIEDLTASKTNVLHHLAVQNEALVILLQKTHCTCADKLSIPGFALAGYSLSRKHGLATFVHNWLKWTLVDQSPATSELDVDGCAWKLIAIELSMSTNLHLRNCKRLISQYSLTQFSILTILIVRMSTGVIEAAVPMESAL